MHASTFQDTALFDGVWGVVGSHTPIHWGSRTDGRTVDGRTDGGRTADGRPAGRPDYYYYYYYCYYYYYYYYDYY